MKFSDEALESAQSYLKIAIATELLILVLAAIWLIPMYQVVNLRYFITDPSIIADTENRYRATLAQIFGGIAIVISLYFTWKRMSTNERRADIAENNSEINLKGQITERFTRAIDQLGNKELEIRTGGIYSLGRIARESDEDYWPIMEILTSYVRKNSPFDIVKFDEELPIDIQACVTVLRRRRDNPFTNELYFINLKNAYLEKSNFDNTELESAIFINTKLSWSSFNQTNLERTKFNRATLNGVCFANANCECSSLIGADLEGVDVKGTNFSYANFTDANLNLVDLTKTKLVGADFMRANLAEADLIGVDLTDVKFRGANLFGADFTDANLEKSIGLSVKQLSKASSLYNAIINPMVKAELMEKEPHLFEDHTTQ